MKKLFLSLLTLLLTINLVSAQDSTKFDNLLNMSLEELMNLDVSVITKKSVNIRKNPAIVTVITEEQIQSSGVRDLRELFELYVPAFQFGVDVEGVVGIGVRGMWGNEGKVLLMINGLECNEDMFATLAFGNHYFLDNIKKIEISRGPGSAIYGGYAGLSVINIITKDNKSKNFLTTSYSQMSKTYAQRLVNAFIGKKYNDLFFNINIAHSQGVRSQLDNIDYTRDTMSMLNNSNINTTFINSYIGYKNLSIRMMADLYEINQFDLWGNNHKNSVLKETFNTYFADISYKIKVKKHEITPEFTYKRQSPWHVDVPDEEYINSKTVSKQTVRIFDNWEINNNISAVSGLEFYNLDLILPADHKSYEETFKNGSNTLNLQNFSAFSQILFFNKIANITLGGRYDYSTGFGQSFVPRIALTRDFKNFYAKAMVSQSFRVPGGIITNRIPENVKGITPEKATNYEAEIGFNTKRIWISSNIFNTIFNKVIVYGSDPETGLGTYINSGKIGTYGIESNIRISFNRLDLMLNYAYYKPTINDVIQYSVPDNDNLFLAFTNHRINSALTFIISKKIFWNTNLLYYGDRYAYVYNDGTNDILKKYPANIILNTNLQFYNILNKIYLQIGINNIFDQNIPFIQPYKGEHAPLPSLSRSLTFKFTFQF